jgi:predicted naringenin-chalcone synthase
MPRRPNGQFETNHQTPFPGWGVDILSALAGAVPGYLLDASGTILRNNGNMSRPSVLFALEETLKTSSPDLHGDFWLVSFGAGFSAHSCRLGIDKI